MFTLRKKKDKPQDDPIGYENELAPETNPNASQQEIEKDVEEETISEDQMDTDRKTDQPEEVKNGNNATSESEEPALMQPFFPIKSRYEEWRKDKMIDEDVNATVETAIDMIENGIKSPDIDDAFFDILVKGADYERAVAMASEAGEIKGRNARISELLKEESESDGVPHPGCGSGAFNPDRVPSIFELARKAL